MCATPVTYHHSVETPFPLQDTVQGIFILAAPLILVKVVRAHDRPGASFLDGRLEGRKVYFIKGTVVHFHVSQETIGFLIVESVVLDARSHSVALDALHVRYDHGRRQERILTEILETAAVKRSPAYVDAGTQEHILLPVASLLADAYSVELGQIRVPTRRESGQCRESGTGIARPASLAPFVPEDFRADTVRAVARP